MKKLLVILLVCLMTAATGVASPTMDRNALIKTEINAQGMSLEVFLEVLSQASGVRMLATPEAADIKIDLQVATQQTVGQVMEYLKKNYPLVYSVNSYKNTIIVMKTPDYNNPLAFPRGDTKFDMGMGKGAVAFDAPARVITGNYNTEEYKRIYDSRFQDTGSSALSTFSIDVDTASYSNVRRFINCGMQPLSDAVRVEEMLNYFSYDYPQPTGKQPFSVTTEVSACPWQPGHQMVLIGLQGENIAAEELPSSNLVFLIDVSGSMDVPNKLPLIKNAFKLLVTQLRPQDTVSIVVYAGRAGMVLEPTSGSEKGKIIKAIEDLSAGGSTAGGEGIMLAYNLAKENFIIGGNNRVILATDGDFNVGVSSEGELTRLIEERRNDGIFLSVLGFGMGNIKDNKMETLADAGNGNYAYIDNAMEAKKVLVEQMSGTLYTIAKDVKLQVEFNPAKVKAYRLIGYENRALANRDFNNDEKDAGDMGAGHRVTALYEIIPPGLEEGVGSTDELHYQRPEIVPSEDLLQVKIRYKRPDEDTSLPFTKPVGAAEFTDTPSDNFRFAAAVAEYAMLLRSSEFKGQANYHQVLELAQSAKEMDEEGYRAELIRMVKMSQFIME